MEDFGIISSCKFKKGGSAVDEGSSSISGPYPGECIRYAAGILLTADL